MISRPINAVDTYGGHFIGWWGLLAISAVACLLWPATGYSQELDPEMEEMLGQIDTADVTYEQTPIPASSVDPVNLDVHWRLWKRVFSNGKPGVEELEALGDDAFSIGYRNMPTYATAVYSMTASKVASGELSVHDASKLYELTRRMAPDLPYPELAYSAHLTRNNLGRLPAIIGSYARGIRKGFAWPDTRHAWELKFATLGLVAFLIAMLFFLLAQLLRYFGIVAYDCARLLPKGFSSNQTVILVVALVVVPGLLLRSPLVSILLLLTTLALVQRINERLVTLAIFGVVAALPSLDTHLSREVTWPDSGAQQLLYTQYLHCDEDCASELEARWMAKEGDDWLLTYSVALAQYRLGGEKRLANVVKLLGTAEEWPAAMRPSVENLLGASLLAQAKPDEAIKHLQTAKELAPKSPAIPFNMMRAYQMKNDGGAASAALDEAMSISSQAVTTHLGLDRRDVNSYLLVEPLPTRLFWERHVRSEPEHVSVISPVWSALSGPNLPLDRAPLLGGIGALLVLLSLPLYLKGKASSPCPKCGLARDPRDAPKTGNHRYCLPCYHTFVSGASLEYDARVHNERVLGRRERFQDIMRRLLSVIMPGTGHSEAGHGLIGFVVSLSTLFGAMILLRPMGLWRPPYELFSDNWAAQKSIAWILISIGLMVALAAVARGVAPTTVSTPSDKRGGDHE